MGFADDMAEIVMLTHRYARSVDRYDPHALLDVFTNDAVLDFSTFGLPRCVGRDDIAAYFAQNRASGRQAMHQVTNHVIDLLDDDTAVGTNYAQAFRPAPDGGQPLVAALVMNDDQYRRSSGRWQISHRVTTPAIDISFDF